MDLADQMNDDVSSVFLNTSEHAESVTFLAVGKTPVTISAIINREEGALVIGAPDGQLLTRRAVLYISTDSTDGIENITEKDVLYFDGRQWKLMERPQNDGYGMQMVRVVEHTRQEISRSDLRINRS